MKWKIFGSVITLLVLIICLLHYNNYYEIPGLSSIVKIEITDKDDIRQVEAEESSETQESSPALSNPTTSIPPAVTKPTIPTADTKNNSKAQNVAPDNTYYHSNQTQWHIQHDKGCAATNTAATKKYTVFTRLNEEFHFLYCGIPKVGSSNWKRVLIALSYPTEERRKFSYEDLNEFKNVHNSRSIKTLVHYPKLDANSTFYRFVLFRHPYTRLVSAWRNKFGKDPGKAINRFYYKQIGFNIIRRLRGPEAVENFDENNATHLLTFQELISGIRMGFVDRHWRSQISLCAPCHVDYDYVGFFEYMNEEQRYLYKYLGFSEEIPIPTKIAHHSLIKSTTDVTRELFEELSKADKDYLYSFYKNDFLILGYSPNTTSTNFPYPSVNKVAVTNVEPRKP